MKYNDFISDVASKFKNYHKIKKVLSIEMEEAEIEEQDEDDGEFRYISPFFHIEVKNTKHHNYRNVDCEIICSDLNKENNTASVEVSFASNGIDYLTCNYKDVEGVIDTIQPNANELHNVFEDITNQMMR